MNKGHANGAVCMFAIYTLLGMSITWALWLAGCGPSGVQLGEVEGVVVLDGKPLQNAEVQFIPEPGQATDAPRSTAVTDDQGRFKLVCDDGRQGAVVGLHRAVLRDLNQYEAFVPVDKHSPDYGYVDDRPRARSRFPDHYGDLSRTPLRKEVKAGKQTIDVELKSRP
jgi:hypothetical protein